jgi:hypothetical protein
MVWIHTDRKRYNKEIMVLTAYNVSQHKYAKVGEYTLFNQQISFYKLNNIRDPDPKKLLIADLTELVKKARIEDKDIILTGDFNELVGDDLAAGGLTGAHSHHHGIVDITTYKRGTKRKKNKENFDQCRAGGSFCSNESRNRCKKSGTNIPKSKSNKTNDVRTTIENDREAYHQYWYHYQKKELRLNT